jgi:hypothetical protein
MTHADDVMLTFHTYAPARKHEAFKSADDPLYRAFVTQQGVELIFLGFTSGKVTITPGFLLESLAAKAFTALTSTSQRELSKRDCEAVELGPTGCRTSHANNFIIPRDEIAEVIAWSPSFLRRLLGDEHLGRARVRMKNGKSHTLRFRDPESWETASRRLADALGVSVAKNTAAA